MCLLVIDTFPNGLPPTALKIITVVIAFVMISFFAGLFGWGILQTWRAKGGNPPSYSDAFVYVATALAALIGGIVAVAFGQSETKDLVITDWVTVLTVIYAITYIVLGVLSLATWVLRTQVTPSLLKNLATTFLGLAIPIVATFFRNNSVVSLWR